MPSTMRSATTSTPGSSTPQRPPCVALPDPTRTILLGNPGGPFHPVLQARYGIPAGYPEPGKASRFFSEDLGKHCIFASFTAASNQHLDLDQYIRKIKVACADDPALLDAWLHGRLDVDIAGAFFGSSYGVRRSLRDVRPGGIQPQDLKRAFVAMATSLMSGLLMKRK